MSFCPSLIRSLFFSGCALVVGATAWGESAAPNNEVFRTLWRGQWVDYVEQGDYAITQGNIIIGHKEAPLNTRLAAD